jgi:methionyl-tRNA formyltransferase
MNVVILTQDDPFFLAENLEYLFSEISSKICISGCVVFDVSPFGRKEKFLHKAKKTFDIFGTRFFIRYALLFLKNKFDRTKNIKAVLKKFGIPIIQLNGSINSEKSLRKIQKFKPDLLVSIAANRIFKKQLIGLAPKGCLNLHTALLPKYRGLMPSFWVLRNNEKQTGVSVFFVDEGIDSGPILIQKKIQIGDKTWADLIWHTKRIGMQAILEAIESIYRGDYQLIENDYTKSSYYNFPTKQDVKEFLKAGKKFF